METSEIKGSKLNIDVKSIENRRKLRPVSQETIKTSESLDQPVPLLKNYKKNVNKKVLNKSMENIKLH